MADTNTWGSEWYIFNGIPITGEGEPIPDGREGERKAWTASAWVYRCIDILMTSAVSVPLGCYEPAKQAGKQPIQVDHDAVGLLRNNNPKDYVVGDDLTKFNLGSLELHGESYMQFELGSRGVPLEIWWRPQEIIEPVLDAREVYAGYKLQVTKGRPEFLPADRVAFLRYPDINNPLRGLGRIAAARNGINLQILGEAGNLTLQKNGMRPSMVIGTDQDIAPDKQTFWQKLLRDWLGGPVKRGRPLVLGNGMKPLPMGMTPVDAEWVNSMRLSQEIICAIFGVPLMIAGNQDKSTYNNYAEARKVLWQDRMIPWLDWYAGQLTRKVLYRCDPKAAGRGLYLGFDYSQIEGLSEDTTALWDRVLSGMATVEHLIAVRAMKPNQGRIMLAELASQVGLDPAPFQGDVEGGDEVFIPYTMIPDHEAGTQTLIDVMAARGANPQLEEDVPGAPHVGDDATKPNPDKPSGPAGGAPKPAATGALSPEQGGKSARLPRSFKAAVATIRAARVAPVHEKLTRKLKRYFQSLQVEVLRNLRNEKASGDAMESKADPLYDPSQLYDRPAARERLRALVAEGLSEAAAAAYLSAEEDFGLDVSWDADADWFAAFMGQRVDLIDQIDQTTADALVAALTEGAAAGEAIPQLADRVSSVFSSAIDYRADLIARTETLQAYGAASIQSYRDGGLDEAEMYDGDNDDSANCADVNGQIVSLEEADRLMGEEHPNGTRGVAPVVVAQDEQLQAAHYVRRLEGQITSLKAEMKRDAP